MTRSRKPKKPIDITRSRIGESDEFDAADDQDQNVEHSISGKSMKYPPLTTPIEPGFYWIAEQDLPIHLVELCIESDSHGIYYVLLPDDDYKYDPGVWYGALWFGPLDDDDLARARKTEG